MEAVWRLPCRDHSRQYEWGMRVLASIHIDQATPSSLARRLTNLLLNKCFNLNEISRKISV
jgi:hypothetical protein